MTQKMKRFSPWGLITGLLVLIIFIAYVVIHLGDLNRFVKLARQAQPGWLLLALLFQGVTYWCAGMVWNQVVQTKKGHQLPVVALARLAIEKLSIDQLFPTAGLSGSMIVVRAMRRQGLPAAAAMEAIVLDGFTYYISFALTAVLSLFILAFYHHITPVVVQLFGFFTLIISGIPAIIWWAIRHRNWRPPAWLSRFRVVTRGMEDLRHVSPKRVGNPRLLAIATLFHLAIFMLDSATLWTMLQVTGTPASPYTAFAALVIGSMAAAVSFMPGGLGGFEVGCTTTLTLLNIPLEAALTATLLLRGLTLWLPLIPGMILARRELLNKS
jgi:uncharacterized protein (TIRG00374 family)